MKTLIPLFLPITVRPLSPFPSFSFPLVIPKDNGITETIPDRLFVDKAFNVVFCVVTLIIVYNLLRSLLGRYAGWRLPGLWPHGGGGGGGGGGGSGGWGGGGGGQGGGGPGFGGGQAPPPPPPPYTKHAQTPTQPIFTQPPQAQAGQGTWWNPGFWTGLAAGGLGAWLVNNRTNNNNNNNDNNNYRARQREDGYRGFLPRRGLFAGREDDWGRGMRFRRVVDDDGDDDNEPWGRGARPGGGGGGGVGEMRRATGFGGTSSR